MANTLANLIVRITGDSSKLIAEYGKAEQGGKRFGANTQRILKGAALGAGVALAGVGAASIKMAADVDKGLREVQTLLPELGDEGFRQLQKDVRALSDEVGIAQTQVIPALYQAISAGVPQENVFQFLKSATDLSIGGVTDLTSATDLLTSATNAFGDEAGSTADVSDAFFTAVRLGKTTIGELSSSFSQAGPLAAALGVSLDDLLAAVSAITLTGAPTSEAFTQVRAAMLSLERATPDMRKALQEMGFETGQAALASLGLQGTIEGLREVADRTGTPLINLTGRAEGMQAILALTGDAAARANGIIDEFGNKSGATADAVATMNESTARLWETFKTRLNNVLIAFGQRILPSVNKALQFLLDNFNEVADGVRAFVGVIADIWRASGLEDTFNRFKKTIGDIRDIFQGLVDFIAGALSGDWARAWDGIKATFFGAWNLIVAGFEEAVNGIVRGFNLIIGAWNTAVGFLKNGVKIFGETIIPGIDITIGKIKEVSLDFARLGDGASKAAAPAIDSFDVWANATTQAGASTQSLVADTGALAAEVAGFQRMLNSRPAADDLFDFGGGGGGALTGAIDSVNTAIDVTSEWHDLMARREAWDATITAADEAMRHQDDFTASVEATIKTYKSLDEAIRFVGGTIAAQRTAAEAEAALANFGGEVPLGGIRAVRQSDGSLEFIRGVTEEGFSTRFRDTERSGGHRGPVIQNEGVIHLNVSGLTDDAIMAALDGAA